MKHNRKALIPVELFLQIPGSGEVFIGHFVIRVDCQNETTENSFSAKQKQL